LITREFYWGGSDFSVNIASLSEPHQHIRIDTFVKQVSSSLEPARKPLYPFLPATLPELDSLIRRLDSQLTSHFAVNKQGAGVIGLRLPNPTNL
jgi:hypothetical protein